MSAPSDQRQSDDRPLRGWSDRKLQKRIHRSVQALLRTVGDEARWTDVRISGAANPFISAVPQWEQTQTALTTIAATAGGDLATLQAVTTALGASELKKPTRASSSPSVLVEAFTAPNWLMPGAVLSVPSDARESYLQGADPRRALSQLGNPKRVSRVRGKWARLAALLGEVGHRNEAFQPLASQVHAVTERPSAPYDTVQSFSDQLQPRSRVNR
jgi:hypothetical protein